MVRTSTAGARLKLGALDGRREGVRGEGGRERGGGRGGEGRGGEGRGGEEGGRGINPAP